MSSTDPKPTHDPPQVVFIIAVSLSWVGSWDAVSQWVAAAACDLACDVGDYEHTRLP
jgi:hypothetical protein